MQFLSERSVHSVCIVFIQRLEPGLYIYIYFILFYFFILMSIHTEVTLQQGPIHPYTDSLHEINMQHHNVMEMVQKKEQPV